MGHDDIRLVLQEGVKSPVHLTPCDGLCIPPINVWLPRVPVDTDSSSEGSDLDTTKVVDSATIHIEGGRIGFLVHLSPDSAVVVVVPIDPVPRKVILNSDTRHIRQEGVTTVAQGVEPESEVTQLNDVVTPILLDKLGDGLNHLEVCVDVTDEVDLCHETECITTLPRCQSLFQDSLLCERSFYLPRHTLQLCPVVHDRKELLN